jgi:hypothetical protein
MLQLSAKIIIFSERTWTFKQINSCEIERDIEKITSTCTLTLPKRTKWEGETGIPVKRGDKISVSLGYDGELTEVFTGYIKKVNTTTPVELVCEDEMYVLKNTATKRKSYANADMKTLLTEQLPASIACEVYSKQTFGKYVVNTDTVSQMLGELSESGFSFFFKEGKLYAGMLFEHGNEITGAKQVFKEGESGNIIDSSDLEWNNAEDMSLLVKASGTNAKGEKISVEVGDKEGEVRSYFKYKTTKAELESEAKKKLTEWKVSGLSGSFTTFGAKPVWLLERIKIKLMEHPSGTYRVTKNVITYGDGGYRQNISIGGTIEN